MEIFLFNLFRDSLSQVKSKVALLLKQIQWRKKRVGGKSLCILKMSMEAKSQIHVLANPCYPLATGRMSYISNADAVAQ
jgi:hypothetical protein